MTYAAAAQGDKARRNAQLLMDLIDNDREILAADLRMKAADIATRRAGRARATVAKKKDTVTSLPWLTKHWRDNYRPALGGVVMGEPGLIKGISKKVARYNAMMGGIRLVHKFMDSPNYTFGTEDKAAATALMGALQLAERKHYLGSAITTTEKDLDPDGMLTGNSTRRILGEIARGLAGNRLPLEELARTRMLGIKAEMAHLKVFPGTTIASSGKAKTGIHGGQEVFGVRWAPSGKEVQLNQGMTLNAEGEIVPKSPRRGYLPQAVTGESLVPQSSSIKRAASK